MERAEYRREVDSEESSEQPDSSEHERQTRTTGRLPPLDGREEDVHYRNPNQDLLTPRITPSKGGSPSQAGQYTISMPIAGGSLPSQSMGTIISVPGDRPTSHHMDVNREGLPRSSQRPVEMIVYFTDKSGISMNVEDGQNAEAGEIFEMVMEEMKFPNEARQAFSLWLVSDFLELQLKPNHVPFKLAAYWEELLERYVDITEEHAERDEPVLIFQRNVFYSRAQEKDLKDPELLRLLYNEAKEMVIDGRYPLNQQECDYLAGLHALLVHKSFRPNEHTPKFYEDKLPEYFPKHMCKKKGLFSRQPGAEDRLVDAHQRAHKKFGMADYESQRVPVYRKYLEFCWKLPFYGAAFFRGQIEKPGKPRLFNCEDNPVYIAVNTEGVFIIDMDDSEFLMGLLFEHMAWNYAEPNNKDNKNCMPCLFYQFTDKLKDGRKLKKVMQVFTREARLVDALMESCLKLKLDKRQHGEDVTDGIADDDRDGVIEALGKTWENFNKLCITTFDDKGQLLSCNAKLKAKA